MCTVTALAGDKARAGTQASDHPWFSEQPTLACQGGFGARLKRPLPLLAPALAVPSPETLSFSVLADQTYLS